MPPSDVALERHCLAALYDTLEPEYVTEFLKSAEWTSAFQMLKEDLHAYSQRDPSFAMDPGLILTSSTSFRAVLHYRLARSVLLFEFGQCQRSSLSRAFALTNRGKLLSGAEIDPRAQIGRRFILDHGYGTVIGETAVIGDDAYILNGVIIGSRTIRGNRPGKRHPTIGRNVQIGAHACIFGAVNIGDNVLIGPYCIITTDVPSHTKIFVRPPVHQESTAASEDDCTTEQST